MRGPIEASRLEPIFLSCGQGGHSVQYDRHVSHVQPFSDQGSMGKELVCAVEPATLEGDGCQVDQVDDLILAVADLPIDRQGFLIERLCALQVPLISQDFTEGG